MRKNEKEMPAPLHAECNHSNTHTPTPLEALKPIIQAIYNAHDRAGCSGNNCELDELIELALKGQEAIAKAEGRTLKALKRFGAHDLSCVNKCSCGLLQAIARAEAK